ARLGPARVGHGRRGPPRPPPPRHSRALAAVTRAAIRRPGLVVVVWLVLVAGCFAVGPGVFTRLVPDVGVVPGSQSEGADTLLRQAGPQPVELTAVVTGRSTSDPAAPDAGAALRRIPAVAEGTDRLASTVTGQPTQIRGSLRPDAATTATAQQVAQRLRRIDNADVVVAGGPLTDNEFNAQAQSDVQRAELLTTPVVLLLLLLIFGGLRAAGLPLLVAV